MSINRLGPIFDPLRNRGLPIYPFIYIGFVKRNDDVQRMGRLSVWIPELGGRADDEGSWVLASYASPFAGASDISKIPHYDSNTQIAQQSYGLWMVPPDLNNEVCVFFANGDTSKAYWFACTWQQSMNFMVPGIPVNITTEPEPPVHVSPVTEYNKSNVGSVDSPRRPPFHPLTDGLKSEGLVKDLERGSSSTSARREAPSRVFGLLTPRGNNMHVDDDPDNEFIRLRTRSGAQILIHETTGYIYINSKNGNAWLEISDAGVDIYSANSVSIRAQQDLNVRADRDIVFDAGGNIALRASNQITMQSGQDVNLSAGRNLAISVKNDGSLHVLNDLNVKADNDLKFQSGSDTSLKAAGLQLRDGSTIQDNAGLSPSATITDSETPAGKDTLDTGQIKSNGSFTWTAGTNKINTISGRMPTHEPWHGHPSSKVPPPPLEDNVPFSGPQGAGNPNNIADDGCSFGAGGTKPISSPVFNAISSAADQVGVNKATLLAFSDLESGHQADIGASSSSAKGLFQFTDGTWNSMVSQYGNLYNVSSDQVLDSRSNALMGAQFIKNNSDKLKQAGVADPTPGQLYSMHFLGENGGLKMIQQAQDNPSADASLMFPAAAAANPSIFRGKTVGEVYTSLSNRANSKAAAYADQDGLPAPCQRAGAVATNPGNSNGSATPSGAVGAAQAQLGKTGGDVNGYLHANGQSLDASQANWCAAFTNASLSSAGVQGSGSNVATSFLKWGQPVTDSPQSGDVVVLANGQPPGGVGGHVGIATGNVRGSGDNLQYEIIQGNYGNRVATSWENASKSTVRRAST